jgi:hypothetical protein
MPSAKPPRPPVFDDKNFNKRLYERVRQPDGKPYSVFDYADDAGAPIGFTRFTKWIRGLRDVVNADAIYLDEVKEDVDEHGERLNTHTARLDRHSERLSALEAQQPPFPIA